MKDYRPIIGITMGEILYEQFARSAKLEEVIKKNLLALGFGI